MEIEQLRKEFNQVLNNIAEHSERFTGCDHLPALEISVLMSKINKLQEIAAILKYTIQTKEEKRRSSQKIDFTPAPEIIPPVFIEEVIEVITEVVTEQQVIIETPIESAIIAPEILVETKPQPTNKESISEKFLHTPISSLKDAFSLNDRYLFANELFDKDMALFNETIKTIDTFSNLSEAQDYLNRAKTTFNWGTDNERVMTFYELVERRFLHID